MLWRKWRSVVQPNTDRHKHPDFWSSAARTVFAMYKKYLNKSIVFLFLFFKKKNVCGLLLTNSPFSVWYLLIEFCPLLDILGIAVLFHIYYSVRPLKNSTIASGQ